MPLTDDAAAEVLASAVAAARQHIARAGDELPPGCAVEQLRNFCGRGWEVLRTPTHAALDRLWFAELPSHHDVARRYADEVVGAFHGVLQRIIERGVADGTFRPVASHAAARLIVAALAMQAFWCNHADAFGPAVAGACNRVVPDTLSVVLGGLRARPSEDDGVTP